MSDTGTCSDGYTATRFAAFGNFTANEGDKVLARITSYVSLVLASSDTAVAIANGRTIVGVGAGTATIIVRNPAVPTRIIGSVVVQVSNVDDAVSVEGMMRLYMIVSCSLAQISPVSFLLTLELIK